MVDLINEMIEYNSLDPKRVNHSIKVYTFARCIAIKEGLEGDDLKVVEASAILHDIGIRVCESKYQSTEGHLQEIEGIKVARPILEKYFDESIIERVLFIIGHHHQYKEIDGLDFQILVEADLIVNIFEDNINVIKIKMLKDKVFKTKTGTNYLLNMYLTKDCQ